MRGSGERGVPELWGFRQVQVGWQWKGACCSALGSTGDFQRTRERRGDWARKGVSDLPVVGSHEERCTFH